MGSVQQLEVEIDQEGDPVRIRSGKAGQVSGEQARVHPMTAAFTYDRAR